MIINSQAPYAFHSDNTRSGQLNVEPRRRFFTTTNNQPRTILHVGAGDVWHFHERSFKRYPQYFTELTHRIVDPRNEEEVSATLDSLKRAGLKVDFRQLTEGDKIDEVHKHHLDGVQAVVVGTPTKYHLDYMKMIAEAGLPVFCEKPGVLPWELDELQRLIANKGDLVNTVDFMKGSVALAALEHPDNGFLKEGIGQPLAMHSRYVITSTLEELIHEFTNRKGLGNAKELGGGLHFDMVPHQDVMLDLMLKVFGVEGGLPSATLTHAYVADGNRLFDKLGGRGLKDRHTEIYGARRHTVGDLEIVSDAGRGLGPGGGYLSLSEWCYATLARVQQ